jgi:ribosomal protein S27AE
MSTEQAAAQLLEKLKSVIAPFQALRQECVKAGSFMADRQPHTCPSCGLVEDILANGVLVTYWPVQDFAPQPDTGLRFVEVGELDLACPACGQVLRQVD